MDSRISEILESHSRILSFLSSKGLRRPSRLITRAICSTIVLANTISARLFTQFVRVSRRA